MDLLVVAWFCSIYLYCVELMTVCNRFPVLVTSYSIG